MSIETRFIHRIVNREEKLNELFKMINNTDLIILSFPLYIDCLPAPLIRTMELIKTERDKSDKKSTPNLIAICNNGFPEPIQNMTALQICRIFSQDCGFAWKGGITVGGGGAIDGHPLEKRKNITRNIMKGLNIAAGALKDGKEIPQKVIDLISKKVSSYTLYRAFANLGFRFELHPIFLAIMILVGIILLVLGTPITISSVINGDNVGLNIGIASLVVGAEFFINGLVFRINIKQRQPS